MGLTKDLWLLDSNRGKLVDVEEATKVDLLRRYSPVGQAIDLCVEQRIEQVEAGWLTGNAVEDTQGCPRARFAPRWRLTRN